MWLLLLLLLLRLLLCDVMIVIQNDGEDELDTLMEADASLQEAERQHAVAQAELQRLQEATAQAKHFRQLGEAMSEDMAELCPDTHRRLLEGRNDEDVVKDMQQYLALITLNTSK